MRGLTLLTAVCLSLQLPVMVQASPDNASLPGDSVGLDRVRVTGWMGERVDRSHRAVQNVRPSIWWNLGSQWGWEHAARWLRNMSFFSTYTGSTEPEVTEDAARFVRMSRSGELRMDYTKLAIGPYSDGEVIKGLLAYYGISRDPAILAAAVTLGQHIAENHHLTTHLYKALAIPALLDLSVASRNESFRKLAIDIAEYQQLAFLKSSLHGAACVDILDGYLRLHKTTGDPRYLEWALKGWKAVRDRMFVTGGLGEVLHFTTGPGESELMCETCQTSKWMIFNLHLWQAMGNGEYLDLAEQILYNQFLHAQSHRGEGGGFCAGGNIDQVHRGIHNYFCCDNEGTLGLLEMLQSVYSTSAGKRLIDVNLFFESEARVKLAGRDITIRQHTEYPERGAVSISVQSPAPVRFTLRVRVPGWTNASEARVNGKKSPFAMDGPYLCVSRDWQSGDTLSVVFPMTMRVEPDITGRGVRSGVVSIEGRKTEAKRIAVMYGPVISAMFRTGHGNDLNWVWTGDYTDVLDCGGDASQGYPGSKPDILDLGSQQFDTAGVPGDTTVKLGDGVPEISWSAKLGDRAEVKRTVKVLPGLPVRLECRDDVSGWDGEGRLLCGGLRFATIKDAVSGYGVCSVPYPAPCVITKPDLDNHVVWAGVYGLFERLENNANLPVTGAYFLNNGYFGAICIYDPKSVKSLVCRQTQNWSGLYFEPAPGSAISLTRLLVFPLAEKPQNQTAAIQQVQKAGQVTVRLGTGSGGKRSLVLNGPVLQGYPLLIPKTVGLKPGWTVHSGRIASRVFDYDAGNVLACVDVPGVYEVEQEK